MPSLRVRASLFAASALGALLAACGPPDIDKPDANDTLLPPPEPTSIAAPEVDQLPSELPFSAVPVRGHAKDAVRIVVTVNEAANPVVIPVSQLDGSFCGDFEIERPAFYRLELVAQSVNALTSPEVTLEFLVDPEALDPGAFFLCDGRRAEP